MKSTFKRLIPTLLLAALPMMASAAGDRTITLTVPVSLKNMDSLLTSYTVRCAIVNNTNGGYYTSAPQATSPHFPITNGAANKQVVITVQIPGNQVANAKGYDCKLNLYAGSAYSGNVENDEVSGPLQ